MSTSEANTEAKAKTEPAIVVLNIISTAGALFFPPAILVGLVVTGFIAISSRGKRGVKSVVYHVLLFALVFVMGLILALMNA